MLPLGSPQFPFYPSMGGVATPWGIQLSPGTQVAAVVRSTGVQSGDDDWIIKNLTTSINAGLSRCRPGKGDAVICLPGHAENVVDNTFFSSLCDGARVIGAGNGSMMPTLSFTATGSQLICGNKDNIFYGLRFDMSQANGVLKAIAASGTDNVFVGNEFVTASGASNYVKTAIEVAATASRFKFLQNKVRGTGADLTAFLSVLTTADWFEMADNTIQTTGASGNIIGFTGAATNIFMARNYITNFTATSDYCVVMAAAAATGQISDNYLAVQDTTFANAKGFNFGAGVLCRCFQNFVNGEPIKSGVLGPAAAS